MHQRLTVKTDICTLPNAQADIFKRAWTSAEPLNQDNIILSGGHKN